MVQAAGALEKTLEGFNFKERDEASPICIIFHQNRTETKSMEAAYSQIVALQAVVALQIAYKHREGRAVCYGTYNKAQVTWPCR